ncbi:retron St85 family RNA-directed DNA polymerase [Lederbergia wuyishanensis]|uniref:RNA-directed DNA polymerase n=1 Tax=Lederbergia wuyishanensis TaxID=1347903 RepID=A0ABU0D0H4_9BACI|nr:retron St85 family RNA-directed DNA polymerase [Lederbergia wuyishanensis]MCJ8006511.1 retron St85 family RNA-directed DNA polymerase [Lederbergia wuyishanensis]MDQ0341888.1 retron-type reverse transcriptase [Lederbergia wuyishanensis]
MKRDFTNTFILNSLELPVIDSLDTLSNQVGISKRMLYLLSQQTNKYYKQFQIPKKNNTFREISSPSYSLKLVQRWILEEVFYKINVTDEALAFKKGVNGIKQNATYHLYSLYILGIDIKDFFPSISREKVFYLFKNLGYNNFISNVLSNLCTLDNSLPQGAVTSPYISNIICYNLDRRIKGLCEKRDIVYSRYADDLTFSCDNKDTLKKMYKVLEGIIVDEGFEVNRSKTRFLSPISHKKLTGITIDHQKTKADKELKKKVRAMIHKSIVTGDYSNNNIILGYVSFINSIENGYKKKVINYINILIMKDYKHYPDLVDAYNKNKLFQELNNMVQIDFHTSFAFDIKTYYRQYFKHGFDLDEMEYYEYLNMLESRRVYLEKYHLKDTELEKELGTLQSAADIEEDTDLF